MHLKLDYIDYKSSTNTLVITLNPFNLLVFLKVIFIMVLS